MTDESRNRAAPPGVAPTEPLPASLAPEGGDPPVSEPIRNSVTVAVWTLLSRLTGLLKVAVIAAVLGPTYMGNLFQATNLLPNITFELLTGALFTSLLVPALIKHADLGDRRSVERLAGGFLGLVLLAFLVVSVVVALAAPWIMQMLAVGIPDEAVVEAQTSAGSLLLWLLIPQVMLYGVIGCASAVQNAYGRFAFTAAAPAVENVAIIGILVGYGVTFTDGTDLATVETRQILWLGIGTTSAVALHAAAQWWGAWRAGAVLLPTVRWRDPEVRHLLRLAIPSLGNAGMTASRTLGVLVVASSIPGGVVAFQLGYNFYTLPEALVARPLAQGMLPDLARAHRRGDRRAFFEHLRNAGRLALFVAVPAVVAYLVLAEPMARAVAGGNMATDEGIALLSGAITGLALGALAQCGVLLCTNAYYARRDARTPFVVTAIRSLLALAWMAYYFTAAEGISLLTLGLIITVSDALALLILLVMLGFERPGGGLDLPISAGRAVAASAVMAVVAVGIVRLVEGWASDSIALLAAALVGLLTYVGAQWITRSPDLELFRSHVGRRPVPEIGKSAP
ncbi:murein biosynthesis integral membrane protein MurJ [Blastococcus sp. TF02A-30]|uniref:murein biosynthesis integral membrane protein MurJ n=1 Tax=Blastococcus sp. TF02A-30 TaxID=2250580 RepID=UPI000DEA4DC1|nr:lipid II flippase MurJ [Blastococcus sp. TF02A-30]RBY84509.1 hypothetical protein DQ241_17670 [Blastococcus sp. TF02A-30]